MSQVMKIKIKIDMLQDYIRMEEIILKDQLFKNIVLMIKLKEKLEILLSLIQIIKNIY